MSVNQRKENRTYRKPDWLKRKLPVGSAYGRTSALVSKGRLHTVCEEAKCPNQWECYSHHTATFLIMGRCCTRNCGFCAVATGTPENPDPDEPKRLAGIVKEMKLLYVVITSVTRDDLPDGGAGCFSETVAAVRNTIPAAKIEVLIPDFKGDKAALETVVNAGPDVLNHNMETVSRLYPEVRPQAKYDRSLELLKHVQRLDPGLPVKSGLMLGLGERSIELEETLKDLLNTGCRILTLGQYLQPTKNHLPVQRFVPPQEFEKWGEIAKRMGFKEVASGPFVRSSYHASRLYHGGQ